MPANLTFPARPDRLAATGMERRCTRCGEWLPLNDGTFYRRPGREFESWCRPCGRQANADRRARRARFAPTADATARRVRRSTTGRKFGVEIEFVGATLSRVVQELTRRGLAASAPGYTHRVTSSWKVVTDASVYNGGELVSPPLSGEQGLADLQTACEALEAAGARVNRSCGLHVHHDVGNLSAPQMGRLFRNWRNTQGATDQLVAASRRGSQWARPLAEREVAHVEALPSTAAHAIRSHFAYVDRYRSLNVASYPRYGTVEVRQHQGTVSYRKIAAWIAYGQAHIAAAVADASLTDRTAHALLDTLAAHGLDAAQVRYLKSRAAHFGFAPVAA
jgi:hypothetical protein